MARSLRVYAAEVDGLHDWVVAAPNMRAALDAFGVRQDLFAQGRARIAEDAAAIAAARAAEGTPLRRKAGSMEAWRPVDEGDAEGWAAALAAAPAAEKKSAAKTAPRGKAGAPRGEAAARRVPASGTPPRRRAPDRRPLMKAESELKAFEREEAKTLGELERERAALERKVAKARADLDRCRRGLERAVTRARKAFEAP